MTQTTVSVPLRGVGRFLDVALGLRHAEVSVPLRGVGCFCTRTFVVA